VRDWVSPKKFQTRFFEGGYAFTLQLAKLAEGFSRACVYAFGEKFRRDMVDVGDPCMSGD